MTGHWTADRLLRRLWVDKPEEIRLEAIAEICGCTVKYRDLDGCAARIVGVGDRAIISVDQHSNEGRQRFSIAHEIGHWLNDHGRLEFRCEKRVLRTPWQKLQDPETRANLFAAELLMPEHLFRPLARNRPITFRTVEELNAVFRTSRLATALRLVELGSWPAMLVRHRREGKHWHKGCPRTEGRFWPHAGLSKDSDAWAILNGGSGNGRPVTVDADDWINHPKAHRYEVIEHSVPDDDGVLTLIWWKDATMVETIIG